VLAGLPRSAELMLSVGTTAGVAALFLTALVPAVRLRLAAAATLRFPAGVAPRIRGLPAVGLITLIAQDASVVAVMCWQRPGGSGRTGPVQLRLQVFSCPRGARGWPIARPVPGLAAAEGARFDETRRPPRRAIMLVPGWAPLCWPVLRCPRPAFTPARRMPPAAYTFAAFRPGADRLRPIDPPVRVLFADARTRVAAVALVAGWLLVIVRT